jgi:hypothetical protein
MSGFELGGRKLRVGFANAPGGVPGAPGGPGAPAGAFVPGLAPGAPAGAFVPGVTPSGGAGGAAALPVLPGAEGSRVLALRNMVSSAEASSDPELESDIREEAARHGALERVAIVDHGVQRPEESQVTIFLV